MANRERESTTIGALLAKHGGSVKTGPFGTALKAKEYSKDGVHLISVGEIGYGTFRISDSTPRVPKEVVDRLPEYLLQTNDIVFGRKGGVDRSAIVKPEQAGWFLGSDGIRLRLPDTCDASFIAYQLQSLSSRDWIIQHATGTTMASLNQEVISRIPIVLPPIDEQRHISHILGALDDKIELNRQLNATLEQLARSLFQSWFVDFDPVRAKASGEPEESICRRLGLTPELLALFPAALEDSAMGEIPVGWTIDKVGNLLTVVDFVANGSFASLKENVNLLSEPGYALYVRTTDYNSGFSKEMRFVDEAAYRFLSKSSLDGSETIISNVGDVGTVFRAPSWLGYPMTLGSNAVAIRAIGASNYIFQYFKGVAGQNQLQSIITGSAQLKFNKTGLRSLPLLIPEAPILDAYEKLAADLANQQVLLEAESRTLATLRDELLPKLLSGEIRLN